MSTSDSTPRLPSIPAGEPVNVVPATSSQRRDVLRAKARIYDALAANVRDLAKVVGQTDVHAEALKEVTAELTQRGERTAAKSLVVTA